MTGFDLFQNLPSKFDIESFQCHECNTSFTDAAEALKHLTSHLPKESYDEIENNENDEYDPGIFDLGEFSSENESEIRRKYFEMAHQPCDIECPNCKENFKSMISWGNHYNDVHKNKCDDIPVSTNGENVSNVEVGSTSQHNVDKSDDISVSTSGENNSDWDSDPPSPVYTSRNRKRIRDNSVSDDKISDDYLNEFCNEVFEEWIEDEAFEVWLDHAVIPAFIELAKRQKRQKAEKMKKK